MNNNNDNNTNRLANDKIWQCIKSVNKEVITMTYLAPLTPELRKKERKSEITII